MSTHMMLSDKEITISDRHPLSAVRGKGEKEELSFDRKRPPAEPKPGGPGACCNWKREKRRESRQKLKEKGSVHHGKFPNS